MTRARVWLNDGLVEPAAALVSVRDRGFTSGDGVFETIKIVSGEPFALTRHLVRLANSARLVGLAGPGDDFLRDAIAATLAANAGVVSPAGRLRITLTAGNPSSATSVPSRSGGSTLVITADAQSPHPTSVSVVTVPWRHNDQGPLVGAKTTSYADNLAVLESVRSRGADEALLADTAGRVCEATTANVVLGVDGVLITPTLATGCLPGVTRALMVEWGLIDERDFPFSELGAISELLLSSSTRNLIPADSLDGRSLVAPGPLGGAAIAEFATRAAQSMDP
ncbi:MAG: aminotransferase class IV [Actinobacteria bacterium]|nr:aminotransferase class IV [Actinomycetota bacterium]